MNCMKKIVVLFLVMFFIPVSYVNAQEELLLKTLTGHSSWIRSVSFSPDGKYIASAGGDGDNRIKLWLVESGECVKTLVGHTNAVTSVSFSPDGKYIASGSWDRTIKLWSVVTGKCIKTLKGKIGVESISFSPDGRYVASGSTVDPIKLWSVASGECIKTLKGPALATRIVLFSPDGKYIASGSDSGTIELWSVESGECLKALKGRTGFAVFGVSFSPDGKYIVSGGDDGTIKLWSVETGECLKALKGHTGTVFSVSFSPDGKYIASGSYDKTVKLWSVESGECMKTLIGHPGYVYSVSFSPDGKYIVSASDDNTVKLWANIFMYKFVYIGSADTELKSVTGRVLTKLPMGTKVEIATIKKNLLYVKVSETLKGWVKEDDVSFEKPDMMKPVIRIVEKSFKEPNLYLKGVVYDDKKIVSVKFGDLYLPRASFEVEKGNYQDVYPFEAKITLIPGMKLVLKAQDRSGKITKVPINIEEPVIDYMPKYVQLEVKEKTAVRKEPSTGSDVLTEVSEKTVLMAIGEKDKWYYLEGGGWIYSDVVKEKEIGIREEVSKPVEVKTVVDVDVNIPEGSTKNPDGLAVVIGARDYESRDIPSVEYAIRDAGVMREYLVKLMGYKEENIIYIENPTYARLREVFGSETNYKGQLYRWVKAGTSDVFVYYAGHGAPDIENKEPYLVPVDCHPQSVALNGYPLELLYQNLSKIPARSQTIVIDACFSGGSDKGMIIKRASPLMVRKGEAEKLPPNSIVLTSCSGNEISSWHPEKRHSLFTYYFLKGLRGDADETKDGALTLKELKNYLDEKVPYYAGRFYNREQHPECKGEINKIIVRYK